MALFQDPSTPTPTPTSQTAIFFFCPCCLLPSYFPKTSNHYLNTWDAPLSFAYRPSMLCSHVMPTRPSIFLPPRPPPPPLACVSLHVGWTFLGNLNPFSRLWNLLRSLPDGSCLRMLVVGVVCERNEVNCWEREEVVFALHSVYRQWCAFWQVLTAVPPCEPLCQRMTRRSSAAVWWAVNELNGDPWSLIRKKKKL